MILKENFDFIFLEYTQTLCSTCMALVPGKIVLKGEAVYVQKQCPEHGHHEELMEEHAAFYLERNKYLKPGTKSLVQTEVKKGCPYDCGICPDHHQHTCIGLIEVTQACNLNCPVCYAKGNELTDDQRNFLSLEAIEKMMDFYQRAENNQAEILQISGGEPTIHPQILEIIQMAKDKNFAYVMINTNGLRIAEDEAFAEALSKFRGNFEIYLQFDGFTPLTYNTLRGKDLSQMKEKALANIKKYKLATTLVTTIYNGVNDNEIGDIVTFAMNTPQIRGINFQPVAFFGRHTRDYDTSTRSTLTGILKKMNIQTNQLVTEEDFIALPCNVDRIAVSYFYKSKKGFHSITKQSSIKSYLPMLNNTLNFKIEDFLEHEDDDLFKTKMCDCMDFVKDIKKVIPKGFIFKSKEDKIRYVDENTFRITVTSFVDRYNFDIKSQQRECVHVITEDLKRIPFSTYNMIYREASHDD